MMVPVSEEVARRVPFWLRAIHDSGARCASITFKFLRELTSNIRSSPEVGGTNFEDGGACDGREPASSCALGSGYARYCQFSLSGERAHKAFGFGDVADRKSVV